MWPLSSQLTLDTLARTWSTVGIQWEGQMPIYTKCVTGDDTVENGHMMIIWHCKHWSIHRHKTLCGPSHPNWLLSYTLFPRYSMRFNFCEVYFHGFSIFVDFAFLNSQMLAIVPCIHWCINFHRWNFCGWLLIHKTATLNPAKIIALTVLVNVHVW